MGDEDIEVPINDEVCVCLSMFDGISSRAQGDDDEEMLAVQIENVDGFLVELNVRSIGFGRSCPVFSL